MLLPLTVTLLLVDEGAKLFKLSVAYVITGVYFSICRKDLLGLGKLNRFRTDLNLTVGNLASRRLLSTLKDLITLLVFLGRLLLPKCSHLDVQSVKVRDLFTLIRIVFLTEILLVDVTRSRNLLLGGELLALLSVNLSALATGLDRQNQQEQGENDHQDHIRE